MNLEFNGEKICNNLEPLKVQFTEVYILRIHELTKDKVILEGAEDSVCITNKNFLDHLHEIGKKTGDVIVLDF